jgi:predicted nucleic acid-binding protein
LNYLLDTNILSELIKKEPNSSVVSFLNSIEDDRVFLSVITVGEIKLGATCVVNNYTLITRNGKDFQNLDIKIINPFNKQ